MYIRPSLNKIIKVRTSLGQMKFCKHFHTRSFCIVNSKENGRKSLKSRSLLDLMAPNFRGTYSSLTSTSENGNETGMRQKSLTLKMCKQPTKNLSTLRSNNDNDPSKEKPRKREETAKNNKADLCRHLCAHSSSNITSEINALKPSVDRNDSNRGIEDLTDAEIKEICETRCPCRERADVKHTQQPSVNVEGSLPAIHAANYSENRSTTIQSKAKDPSEATESFATIVPSKSIKKIARNRRAQVKEKYGDQRYIPVSRYGNTLSHTSKYLSMANSSRNTNRIAPDHAPRNLSKQKGGFSQNSSVGAMHPMQSISSGSSNKLISHYARMARSKQSNRLPFIYRPTKVREIPPTSQINPHQTHRIDLLCHFEQLHPIPSRFIPIYPKNRHSVPVVEYRSPRDVEVPYLSLNLSQRYGQSRPINSPVFGSQSSKNRQTFGIQSNIPSKFVTASININNVTKLNMNGNALPTSEIDKGQLVNTADGNTETIQKSRKIMSKLVENLAVVIDGPGKLKLVTAPCPKLRNENDVLIRMEYVNLTDADVRHYLTGKYNAYSYATTTVGRTGSGTIIETGQNVDNVKPGDKVFVKPISCGKCSLCLSDHRNLCEYVTAAELSETTGVLSRLHVHSSELVTKIPDNVSISNGAMTSTLSTAIRACQKASVSAGDVVMVMGGGALGMATSLAAQLLGATTVCLADIRKSVLDEAEKLGIENVFLIDPRSPSKNIAIKLYEQIGVHPRVTFDCTGARLTNEIAIDATQTGGKVIVMTNSETDFPLPISSLVSRHIDLIISTCGNDESAIAAMRLLSTKKIFFGSLLCKHYDLSNVQEAFDDLQGPNRLDSQIIVKCGCACGKKINSDDKKSF